LIGRRFNLGGCIHDDPRVARSAGVEVQLALVDVKLGAAVAIVERRARGRVEHLLGKLRKGRELDPEEIERILVGPADGGEGAGPSTSAPARAGGASTRAARAGAGAGGSNRLGIRTKAVEPRGPNQRRFLEAVEENHLVFSVGVAGTGKTFLAVAAAVRGLREGRYKRLVISRPVVEAGERLGFLPGDVQAKLDPYMRPVYDALYELIGFEDVARLEDTGVIEIAPLAYMRGRTLSRAFVILDEAQNATSGQMRMFLTRLGERSKMVVTGDPTQSDLEAANRGGFMDAVRRLRGFEGVAVVEYSKKDIVRHPLVEKIVKAYEAGGGSKGEAEA